MPLGHDELIQLTKWSNKETVHLHKHLLMQHSYHSIVGWFWIHVALLLSIFRNAHHNLYQCFQSAFEDADFCNCAVWQVEEAAMWNHGYESDYSRHMNMHCQGWYINSNGSFQTVNSDYQKNCACASHLVALWPLTSVLNRSFMFTSFKGNQSIIRLPKYQWRECMN